MKKGMSIQFTVTLILFVIIAVLLLMYASSIFEVMKYKHIQYTCKASIRTAEAASFSREKYDIKCPTLYETIEEGSGSEEEREEQYMKDIAERMAYTWNLFKEGQVRLFGSDEKYCIITHNLEFEEKTELSNFRFWAYLGKHTADIDRKKRTYLEYLKPPIYSGIDPAPQPQVPMEISTEEPLAVVYTYSKAGLIKKLLLPGEPGVDVLTLFYWAVGKAELSDAIEKEGNQWESAVLVIPYNVEYLSKLGCTNLPADQGKINKAQIS